MESLFNFIDQQNYYLRQCLIIFGFFCLLIICVKIDWNILKGLNTFVLSRIRSVDLISKYGEVVVITGATDGIGLEFAIEFAKRGHSIVILGRSEEKLKNSKLKVSESLKPGKVVATIQADLDNNDPEVFYNIRRQLLPYQYDIGILINNAGVAPNTQGRYMEIKEEVVMQTLRVNITAVLMVTRMILPFMVEQRRGLVINMSSITSVKPSPFTGIYSAGKEFLNYFGRSLGCEYKKYNIDVLTLTPGFVVTKMTSWSDFFIKPSMFVPSAKTFVKSAIATIGHTNFTTGYWSHGLQWTILSFVPITLFERFADYSRRKLRRRHRNASIA